MKNSGNLTAFSKGLYSNWFYHKPTRTLFDCGEGCATYFGNLLYGIERICISHGHGDHVLGLPSLIGCRNSGRGDKEKPLEIYYPHDNTSVRELQSFIMARNRNLNYDIKWIPMLPAQDIPINNKTYIESFRIEHQRNNLTLGYNIVEKRSRLKPEYVGKNIPEILKSGGVRSEDLNEIYHKKILSYCLDAWRLNQVDIKDTDLAIMDCTFLSDKDRDDSTHFTLDESYKICVEAGAKSMLAAHFSGRYHPNQIIEAFSDLAIKNKLEMGLVMPGNVYSN